MPRGVNNWNFSDVVTILKQNGFRLHHIKGSHYFYLGFNKNKTRLVCIPKHGSISFKPRTLKSMVEQSGLSYEVWGL